jgi:site-specific recombinase XerD
MAAGADSNGENQRLLLELDTRFEEFADFVYTVRSHSPASIRGYRAAYKNFRKYLVDEIALAPEKFQLAIFGIERWVQWNRKRGLGPVSTNTYWRALRTFFNDLEKRDALENPFRGLKAPPTPNQIGKAHRPDDCRRILAAADNYPWKTTFERARAVAMLGIMIYAGLRRGEVLRLEFNDVNLDDGTIRIRLGKGRYGGKDRTGYMPHELRLILRLYITERNKLRIVCPEFFASERYKRGLSVATIRRLGSRVRAASGIKFTLHSLRHSYVTWLLRSGIPIHVAKELAGHADITTTEKYLRVFDEDLQSAVRGLRLS